MPQYPFEGKEGYMEGWEHQTMIKIKERGVTG